MTNSGRMEKIALLSVLTTGSFAAAPRAQSVDTTAARDTARMEERSVDIGGYGSFRLDGSDAGDDGPSFAMRRLILTTDARVTSRLQLYTELEFERFSEIELEKSLSGGSGGAAFEQAVEGTTGSEISLEQAWGQFNLSPNVGIQFGAVLPPVGRVNYRHDDNLWNYGRRPLIDRAAQVLPVPAAWTEMGLGVVGTKEFASGARLGYWAYVLNGATLDFSLEQVAETSTADRSVLEMEAEVAPMQGPFDGSKSVSAVSGRLEFSPRLGSEIGLSGYYGGYTPELIEDAKGKLSTLGLDGRQKLGPAWIEGEFLYTRYSNLDRVFTEFARAVGTSAAETEEDEAAKLESEVAVALSGLAKNRYGFWLDLSRPYALRPGFFGLREATLIPNARYERAWLDGDLGTLEFSNGQITNLERGNREQDRLALGLAFRPVPLAVFTLHYERSNAYRGALIDPATEDGEGKRTVNMVTLGMAIGF